MAQATSKEHAHELIERMAPGQVSAVVRLIEAMLDPLAGALGSAPYDDEPVSEDEARALEAARIALARGERASHQEVLAEFGLSSADWERMQRTPLEPHGPGQ